MLKSKATNKSQLKLIQQLPPSSFTVYRLPSLQPGQLLVDGNKGEKAQCLNKPPNIPQMIAKLRLDVLFLSYSHHHRLYHLMPCTSSYMHPNPSISDFSFCSCRPGYMLLLEVFDNSLDEFNQKTKNNHLPTLTPIPHLFHNLTPSSLHVKLPLNIPIIPSV